MRPPPLRDPRPGRPRGALRIAGRLRRQFPGKVQGRCAGHRRRHDTYTHRPFARRTRAVTRRDIELFTEISGDRNPIHYDEELAAQSRFGGIVVQGGVTSGLLNAVVAEELPGPGSVFLEVNWKFRAPVRPGDEITAEVTVTSAREDKPDHDAGDCASPTRTASSCSTAPRSSGVTRSSLNPSTERRSRRGIRREGRGKVGL